MKQTANYGLNKPDATDVVDIEYLNANMDTVDVVLNDIDKKAEQAFQQASDGKSKIKTAITGVDSSVVIPTNATFQELATCISKIKTGVDTADATAKAEQILAGMSAYVNGKKLIGTMVNRGAVSASLDAGNSYTIPTGYHNGSGKVTANSLASQTSATATASDILNNKTAYVNGSKITGEIPVLATSWNGKNGGDANAFNDTTMIAGNSSGTIDTNEYVAGLDIKFKQGYNGGGIQRFHLPNLLPQNIKAGTKVGFANGYLQGTFTSDATADADLIVKGYSAYVKGNKLKGTIEPYYDGDEYENVPNTSTPGLVRLKPSESVFMQLGSQISRPEPNLIAANILKGKNILGIVGSMHGYAINSGTHVVTSDTCDVISVWHSNNTTAVQGAYNYVKVSLAGTNEPAGTVRIMYAYYDNRAVNGRLYFSVMVPVFPTGRSSFDVILVHGYAIGGSTTGYSAVVSGGVSGYFDRLPIPAGLVGTTWNYVVVATK